MMTTPIVELPGDARSAVLRAFLRQEKLSLAMQMATVTHHSWYRAGRADASTQTVTYTDAATCAATPAPSTVIEYVVPAVTYDAPPSVIEYVAPAPVIEYIAPAPAVTCAASSQQSPPAYTMTTVTTGVNLDITCLMNPQFSITAVEASAPQVVWFLFPLEEFAAPVYN